MRKTGTKKEFAKEEGRKLAGSRREKEVKETRKDRKKNEHSEGRRGEMEKNNKH